MSRRSEKAASVVHRVVAGGLRNLAKDAYLTVTGVEVSADMKHTKVWVSALDYSRLPADKLTVLLTKHRDQLQKELATQMKSRSTPKLELKVDSSAEHAQKIDERLDKIDGVDSK